MAWFKIDDGLWSHPKWVGLTEAAQSLWVRAGTWSAQNLTDGVVPKTAYRVLNARPKVIAELIASGLWEPHAKGVMFHDWEHYQLSSERAKERKARTRERVANWRENKRKQGDGNGVTQDVQGPTMQRVTNAAPVPEPVPEPVPDHSPNGESREARERAAILNPTTQVGAAFAQVWSVWPRVQAGQESKSKAVEAFRQMVHHSDFNGDLAAIVRAVTTYSTAYIASGEPLNKCRGLERWGNDEAWRDPLPQPVQRAGQQTKSDRFQQTIEMGRQLQEAQEQSTRALGELGIGRQM